MSKLYLIPTPIGNLQDITLRALTILKEVGFILAEDTRHTQTLLHHFEINKPLVPFHKFNEHKILNSIIIRISDGEVAGLVTDGGTPGISDPGYLIVRECIRQKIPVECLPGPTALIPALVLSGLPADRFCFEGFLPVKKGRKSRISGLKSEERTIIFYESPYRLHRTLNDLMNVFGGDRKAAVVRELSKIYEECRRGELCELAEYYNERKVKGEIVLVVAGCG